MNFLKKYAWGILLCLVVAVPAWLLGKRFEVVGGPVFAILIGMVIALFWKEQGGAKPGITYKMCIRDSLHPGQHLQL